jgi:nicotinamide-nucleotide amidase
MASGAIANSAANRAVAVTGIAGPDGGTHEKPVGTVFIAWATRQGEGRVAHYHFHGNRQAIREQTILAALQGCFL